MSIHSQRTMAELAEECRRLGLEVVPAGKKISKTDYILSLRDYHLRHDFDEVPKSLTLFLEMDSPMLCSRYTDLKPADQETIWESEEWFLEEKIDGCRMVIVKVGEEWEFFSRNNSVTDFLPIRYREHIKFNLTGTVQDDFILDCEIVPYNEQVVEYLGENGLDSSTQLQAVTSLISLNSEETLELQSIIEERFGHPALAFRAFDLAWFNGSWVTERPLLERRAGTRMVVDRLVAAGIPISLPLSSISSKRAFYRAVVAAGGEGCVAKNLYSTYNSSNSRKAGGWVKIKRSMSESMGMIGLSTDLDAYVSGFEPADPDKSWAGYVGALEFSVLLRTLDGEEVPHKIAKISGLSMEERVRITEWDAEGNPILGASWYGKVATIDGVCVSGKSRRLKHATFVEWRGDRSADTCVMDEAFLNSMIL